MMIFSPFFSLLENIFQTLGCPVFVQHLAHRQSCWSGLIEKELKSVQSLKHIN